MTSHSDPWRIRLTGGAIFLLFIVALFPNAAFAQSDSDDLLPDPGSESSDLLLDDTDDDLLLEESSPEEDLLTEETAPDGGAEREPADRGPETGAVGDDPAKTRDQLHASLFLENRFPSAATCAQCHPKHYREWSVSPHAYAQLSPVANSMAGTMLKRTSGTIGDFCYRCHNPVGMNLGEPLFMSSMDRHPASREGITCVVCHRIDKPYGKIAGRLAMVEGDITQPMYGPTDNENLQAMLDHPDVRVTTDPDQKGRKIHREIKTFTYISKPGSCGVCHDVMLVNGMRIEETFTEYKHSPAAKRGETCQDCHMGKTPGKAEGYEHGPAATVGGVDSPPRKLTSHIFAGPDYSLVHPGFFPHNPEAAKMATIREWITFDHEAGWGTDEFEDNVPEDYEFPPRWISIDDRYDARAILDEQFKLLELAEEQRKILLRNGYKLGEIRIREAETDSIRFDVEFRSGTDGHSAPSGFERVVFFQVTVTDAAGKAVFKSGDLDPNGDLRDLHSAYVHNGELPLDKQLFNLQHKFITRNIRGGEREQVLASNLSIDPLPFARPDPRPSILLGRPLGARVHRKGVRPGDNRWAKYHVDRDALEGSTPPYNINVKLIAGMVPVNLVHEVSEVGFDFMMTPRQVADRLVAGHQVLWEKEVVVEPGGRPLALNR